MTKNEIKKMVNTCNNYYSCALCPYNPEDISRFIGDRWKGGCPDYDRKLVYAMGKGYGNVSEYEAEREMLGSQIKVLKQRLNDKYIEIDNLNRDYRNAFERLKSQQRENERLKAENKKVYAVRNDLLKENDELIKTNAELLLLPKQAVKQAKIEVLNELWEKVKDEGVDYKIGMRALSEEIDELIKELIKNDT